MASGHQVDKTGEGWISEKDLELLMIDFGVYLATPAAGTISVVTQY